MIKCSILSIGATVVQRKRHVRLGSESWTTFTGEVSYGVWTVEMVSVYKEENILYWL